MSSDSDEVQDLFARVAACRSQALKLSTSAFRSAGVRYANEDDLLSGNGASFYGGRWNRPGIRAIYLSLDPITAVKETYQEFLRFGFKVEQIRPRVLAGVRLNVKRLLDVTDARIRRRLGFRLDEIIGEDWHAIQCGGEESWTQAIGRGAVSAEFEGILAPSARNRNGRNVIIFPMNLAPSSTVEAMGKDELPPHPSAWPR